MTSHFTVGVLMFLQGVLFLIAVSVSSFSSFINPIHQGLYSQKAATIIFANFLVCLSSGVFLLYTWEAISIPSFLNISPTQSECKSDKLPEGNPEKQTGLN